MGMMCVQKVAMNPLLSEGQEAGWVLEASSSQGTLSLESEVWLGELLPPMGNLDLDEHLLGQAGQVASSNTWSCMQRVMRIIQVGKDI